MKADRITELLIANIRYQPSTKSLSLQHGIRIYLQKTADSGHESDAEIYI